MPEPLSDDAKKSVIDTVKDFLKSFKPEGVAAAAEVAEELKKRDAEIAKQATEIQKLRDQREHDQYIAKAQGLKHLPGVTADAFASILRKAEAGLTTEERVAFDKMLAGANEALRQSALFQEVGGSAGVPTEPWGKVEQLAKERIQKDGRLTEQQAIAAVLETKDGQALWAQHNAATARKEG